MEIIQTIPSNKTFGYKPLVVLSSEILEQLQTLKDTYNKLEEGSELHTKIRGFYSEWGKQGKVFLSDWDEFCIELPKIMEAIK